MRVAYHTFGCKTNQYDTERLRQEIERRGATTVLDSSQADVVVVNTCTVTSQADAQARRYLRRVARAHPGARVVAVGCSTALRAADYRRMPEVSDVVPGHDPHAVAVAAGAGAVPLVELTRGHTPSTPTPPTPTVLRERRGATRGWLKIQDGCDRKCSFCATRLARGESRSRRPGDIEREAKALAASHPELVITGVHIGHYGRDLVEPETLSGLMRRLILSVPGVRFRLGSIEATEVDDTLLEMLEGSGGRLAPHLHMPLQSGADPVLRRMRRWYRAGDYRRRTEEIASRLPVLGLGADVIAGFPGETEADHRATVQLVTDLPYTYLHVFPYSPREGTAAEAEDGVRLVPERVAGERSRELRELAGRKAEAYERMRVGSPATVAPEAGGQGVTGDYLRVRAELPARLATEGRRRLWSGPLTLRRGELAIDLTRATPFI